MNQPGARNLHRVGALRPNQLLHTYGVGAVADLPNLSVMMMGLDYWDLQFATPVVEDRLLAAVRSRLGPQVEALWQPPHKPETSDPFGDWARTGVPVGVFPSWLRCSDTRCNRLARIDSDLFTLMSNAFLPDKVRYVHSCRGNGNNRPTAVPARFVLACDSGHLDDFPWQYFVHRGNEPQEGHTLRLTDSSTTGEAASVYVRCECGQQRSMADAFGVAAEQSLPICRGRHPHLGQYEPCDNRTRTLVLGATNGWFAMLLQTFSLPRADLPVDQLVAEHWGQLQLLATLPADTAKQLMRTQFFWSELEPYGVDSVWSRSSSMPEAATTTRTTTTTSARRSGESSPATSSTTFPTFRPAPSRVRQAPNLGWAKSCWPPACAKCRRCTGSPASTRRSGARR